MRDWKLTSTDPLALTLAADARLSKLDYCNDHIWEISLKGGEPPAVDIHTTYSLRALSMRIFPRYIQGNTTVSDPAVFLQPPAVRQFYPNYLLLTYTPLSGLDVTCEYYVPDSQLLIGRLRLLNTNVTPIQFRLEMVAILVPLREGSGMSPAQIEVTSILQGKSGGLQPVFFMTGGPEADASSFPCLAIDLNLMPGINHQVTWSLASLSDQMQSSEAARQAVSHPLESELVRLEMLNSHNLLEIETGEKGWDAAFAFSQKAALSSLFNSSTKLPYASFVLSRQPDYGFSRRGDGSDYDHAWDGQSPIDAYFLTEFLIPGATEQARGLLMNFLSTQAEDGSINHRPGLAGQLARFSAAPILTSLTWRLYQASQDKSFLADLYPSLVRFVKSWFNLAHDRDQDGFPEWDHPQQALIEDNPAYDLWHTWGRGHDITTFENPGLGSLLYMELHNLVQISRLLKRPENETRDFINRAEKIKAMIETCWDPCHFMYRDRDRDTHESPPGENLGKLVGPGEIQLHRQFKTAQRLNISILLQGEATRPAQLTILGKISSEQKEEVIFARSLTWIQGRGIFTTQENYDEIESISILGVDKQDETTIRTVSYAQQDISNFLPLWAGIPSPRRAAAMVKKNILAADRFNLPFGLPLWLPSKKLFQDPTFETINLPINTLIAEGLLRYGYIIEAAQLFQKWMSAIVDSLQNNQAFYSLYNARSGAPLGIRHAFTGMAPIRLFLEILGLRIISPTHLVITGRSNPFPWPVQINFRGMTIKREDKFFQITFPGGQTTRVNSSSNQEIRLA